jgi:hypothetical protein
LHSALPPYYYDYVAYLANMMFISSHDDDEKNNELGVAEYYTAILSPPCMMRMYRHMLITQTALLNATAAYEDE